MYKWDIHKQLLGYLHLGSTTTVYVYRVRVRFMYSGVYIIQTQQLWYWCTKLSQLIAVIQYVCHGRNRIICCDINRQSYAQLKYFSCLSVIVTLNCQKAAQSGCEDDNPHF